MFDIRDFGAVLDGVTDDTAAWVNAHAALPASGGSIEFPGGISLVSSVAFTKPTRILGRGTRASVIKTSSATADVFTFSGYGSGSLGVGYGTTVVRTAGAFTKFQTSWKSLVLDVEYQGYFIGLDIDSTVGFFGKGIYGLDGTASSVASEGGLIRVGETGYCGGIDISSVTADMSSATTNDPTQQPSYGILARYVDFMRVSAALFVHHGSGLKVAPHNGQTASVIHVNGCSFDTGLRGIEVNPEAGGVVTRCSIAQTWVGENTQEGILIFGNAGTIGGIGILGLTAMSNMVGVGVVGPNTSDIGISGNSRAIANAGNGLQVTGTATDVTWDGGILGAGDRNNGNGSSGAAFDATSTGWVRNAKMSGNALGPFSNANPAGVTVSGCTPLVWTNSTPAVTAETGTITSASCVIRHKQIDKVLVVDGVITITTNGTGAVTLLTTLPFNVSSAGLPATFTGRESAVANKAVMGFAQQGTNQLALLFYDGTYPGANGASVSFSGTYEID